jgi:hypothetical protein
VFQVTGNQLTSLPPELGLLTNLKSLSVRQWWQMDLDLNRVTFSGRQEPAHVAASWNWPAETARVALRTIFELSDRVSRGPSQSSD